MRNSGARSNQANAESQTIELGWGNITDCTTVEWRNDGLLGTPSPTVLTAEQRVYAYAIIDAPTVAGLQNDLQQCAVQGVAAATLTSIISSPAGAMPAFSAQFENCMRSRARTYFSLSLQISEGQCMWDD